MELEEAIKELQEKIETINTHLKNYEKDGCLTAVYENLKSEKEALETILNHLTKQEKMIELMVEKYNDDFGDIGDFCQHEYCSKDYNCKECIKQSFEKKAEESE